MLHSKNNFNHFLSTEKTLSLFDKAFYSQLFARIGVRFGHNPKDFKEYVKVSLLGYADLDLDKRVVFTAKKFAEVNLISEKELQKILHKYESRQKPIVQEEEPNQNQESEADAVSADQNVEAGITLRCLGRMRALDPLGNEIISRRWGKQKPLPSHHKTIVLELIRAKLDHRPLLRKELLVALFPQMRKGITSKKVFEKYDATLSVRLSQVKKSFAPYEIFVKTTEGYELHPSVRIDLLQAREYFSKGKTIAQSHPVCAQWLFGKTKEILDGGIFAPDVHRQEIQSIRKEMNSLEKHVVSSLKSAQTAATL